jgi:hypothetical protein
MGAGASNCTRACAMELNDSSTKPAMNSSTNASGYMLVAANPPRAQHHA